MIIGHKLNFMTVWCSNAIFYDKGSQLWALISQSILGKILSFCAHWTGNLLNFSKLLLLLSVAHFWRPLAAFKRSSPFFLEHPAEVNNHPDTCSTSRPFYSLREPSLARAPSLTMQSLWLMFLQFPRLVKLCTMFSLAVINSEMLY